MYHTQVCSPGQQMFTHSPSPPSYHLLLNLGRHIPMQQTTPEDHLITFPHSQNPRGLWALQWLSTSWVPSSELVKGSSPSRPVLPKEPFLGLWLWGLGLQPRPSSIRSEPQGWTRSPSIADVDLEQRAVPKSPTMFAPCLPLCQIPSSLCLRGL